MLLERGGGVAGGGDGASELVFIGRNPAEADTVRRTHHALNASLGRIRPPELAGQQAELERCHLLSGLAAPALEIVAQPDRQAIAHSLRRLPADPPFELDEDRLELVKGDRWWRRRSLDKTSPPPSPPGQSKRQSERRGRRRQHPLPRESAHAERIAERRRLHILFGRQHRYHSHRGSVSRNNLVRLTTGVPDHGVECRQSDLSDLHRRQHELPRRRPSSGQLMWGVNHLPGPIGVFSDLELTPHQIFATPRHHPHGH